jgi:hypothetical protein
VRAGFEPAMSRVKTYRLGPLIERTMCLSLRLYFFLLGIVCARSFCSSLILSSSLVNLIFFMRGSWGYWSDVAVVDLYPPHLHRYYPGELRRGNELAVSTLFAPRHSEDYLATALNSHRPDPHRKETAGESLQLSSPSSATDGFRSHCLQRDKLTLSRVSYGGIRARYRS